jgi:hypothetical protein
MVSVWLTSQVHILAALTLEIETLRHLTAEASTNVVLQEYISCPYLELTPVIQPIDSYILH